MDVSYSQLGPHPPERRTFSKREYISIMFSEEIETLQKSTWTLQKLMGKDTFDLNHAMKQPEKLRALGIFDEETARLLAEAWLTDGGFFMVLYSIGIELDSDIVRMAETNL